MVCERGKGSVSGGSGKVAAVGVREVVERAVR